MIKELAKLSSPRPANVYNRIRLFKMIDDYAEAPSLWICSPAGSGKTTLAASYIAHTKRSVWWYKMDSGDSDAAGFFHHLRMLYAQHELDYDGLPVISAASLNGDVKAFARNFFRLLFRGMAERSVLVFDNFQDNPSELIEHILAVALEEIPAGIKVMILSRLPPPQAFSRQLVAQQLRLLDWEALQLTAEETEAIGKVFAGSISSENAKRLHEKTRGWVAGIVLMLANKNAFTDDPVLDTESNQSLFDYFAGEVFRQLDAPLDELLLKTAFLPYVTPDMAEALSGIPHAENLLQDLSQRNYFTYLHDGKCRYYDYHPLFKQFLEKQAVNTLDAAAVKRLYLQAARLLLEHEQYEHAFSLYARVEQWRQAADIVKQFADRLLNQGRHQVVREWLHKLPEEVGRRDNWLIFWRAAATITVDPMQAQKLYEQAFANFDEDRDAKGCYLSWAGIIECIWFTLLPAPMLIWIDRFEILQKKYPNFPDAKVEVRVVAFLLIALFWAKPDHPRLRSWIDRAMQLWQSDISLLLRLELINRLYLFCSITGNLAKAREIKEICEGLIPQVQDPLAMIFGYMANMYNCGTSGEYAKGLEILHEAERLFEESGIRAYEPLVWSFGVRLALLDENLVEADRCLNRVAGILAVSPQPIHKTHYDYLMGWRAIVVEDYELALEYTERAVRNTGDAGAYYPHCESLIVHAMAFLGIGRFDDALQALMLAEDKATRANFEWIVYSCRLAKAIVLHQQSQEPWSLLSEAMTIGRKNAYAIPFSLPRRLVAELFAHALIQGIHTDDVSRVIQKLQLRCPDPYLEQWPWPVKFYTLGGFEIIQEGKPLEFNAKSQRKPLGLLKVLIALGGTGVNESRITDVMWPDAEGDSARKSLDTTVYRLRKLLGGEIVEFKDKKLSLNRNYLWVDVWAFERCLAQTEMLLNKPIADISPRKLRHRSEYLWYLYRGPFLQFDSDDYWVLELRSRHKNRLLQLLRKQGEFYIQSGDLADAVDVYETGLKLDALVEEFYQQLMLLHIKMHNQIEARKVYDRCCEILRNQMALMPSQQTQAIFQAIQE